MDRSAATAAHSPMFRIAAEAGLPKNEFFAHQIPGEGSAAARCRSSASPVRAGLTAPRR